MQTVTEHSWNSEPEVGALISALIDIQQAKNVLEIGVFKGATSLYMMKPGVAYTGIDIEDFREEPVKAKMADHTFIVESSLRALKNLSEKQYDLIFIDSVHEYEHCMAEFKECERLIKSKGLICFHDAVKFFGVTKVIDYIRMFKHFDVLVLDTPDHPGRGGASGMAVVRCNY